jgi:hypothetical protein
LLDRKTLELTILDSESLVPPPVDLLSPDIHVWLDHKGVACAHSYTVDDYYWMHISNLASFRFSDTTDKVIAIPHASGHSEAIREIYYRSVLPMVLQALGQEGLHASGVRMAQGVVAFCGPKESGKSTVAFGLSRRGHELWADDTVMLDISERAVNTLRLPFQIRLRPEPSAYFGQVFFATSSHGDEYGSRHSVEGLPAPLAAICLLERATDLRGECPVEIVRLTSSRALLRILPHAHCFGFHNSVRKRRMSQNYLKLIDRIPVLAIRMRAGLVNLPVVLNAIEASVNEVLRNVRAESQSEGVEK